jgi:hypothetical protein
MTYRPSPQNPGTQFIELLLETATWKHAVHKSLERDAQKHRSLREEVMQSVDKGDWDSLLQDPMSLQPTRLSKLAHKLIVETGQYNVHSDVVRLLMAQDMGTRLGKANSLLLNKYVTLTAHTPPNNPFPFVLPGKSRQVSGIVDLEIGSIDIINGPEAEPTSVLLIRTGNHPPFADFTIEAYSPQH